jgi:archaellum component FlaF (FlaF/FlaG flagellin family)
LKGWLTGGVCLALLASASYPRETAQAAPQAQSSVLKITPLALNFPAQAANTAGAPLDITLTNNGDTELQVTDILVSGIDFAESSTCGASLAAGASCAITVTFKPATTGPRLGTMSIVTSDRGSPRLLALSGIGKE